MAKLEIDVLQIEIDTALADKIRELEARAEKAEAELAARNRRHTDAAPAAAELASFAQSAIEEVSDSWMYRATLHAQWACFYCNTVVEWVGDDGDEAVCEHFPGCLHLRARALRDNDGAD